MLHTDPAAARDYPHVFVAPHLDDVVLSCGGLLTSLVERGQRALVVTICAGSAGPEVELSAFATYLHHAWKLGSDPLARRRSEDAEALAHLKVDGLHLPQLDAVYRAPGYPTWEAVIGPLQEGDQLPQAVMLALGQLQLTNPEAKWYLPLAVGNHVDHQAVFQAAGVLQGSAVAFYEDFPYAAQQGAVQQRIAALGALARWLTPEIVSIARYLPVKIEAIAHYRSQLDELFHGRPLESEVRGYAEMVGGAEEPSERLWLLTR